VVLVLKVQLVDVCAAEVIHNNCNMCTCDLPDMYTLSPRASGICIYQHAHVTTIACRLMLCSTGIITTKKIQIFRPTYNF